MSFVDALNFEEIPTKLPELEPMVTMSQAIEMVTAGIEAANAGEDVKAAIEAVTNAAD